MVEQKALPVELVGRGDGAGLLQQGQRRQPGGARGLDHGLVLGGVLVRAKQDLEQLLADRLRAAAGGQLGRPVGDQLLDDLFLLDRGQRLLQDLGRGLLETALAGTAEVVRRLEQAKQGAGLLRQRGVGAEIVARQVGKAEFALGRKLPGQLQLDGLATAAAWASSSAGAGFSNLIRILAALTLTRLPLSSSTCEEASASDNTRPAMNLPASSNNTCMAGIVPAIRQAPQRRPRKEKSASRWSSKSLRAWSPAGSSLIRAPG
jgi:hypothetical protein